MLRRQADRHALCTARVRELGGGQQRCRDCRHCQLVDRERASQPRVRACDRKRAEHISIAADRQPQRFGQRAVGFGGHHHASRMSHRWTAATCRPRIRVSVPGCLEEVMPQASVDGLSINYDVQGDGDPLLLVPYLSADHACYAFQLPAYTEHFSCIAVDLPGSGESDTPPGPYSTDGYADQVAAFLGAIGVESAHVAGVSLGAAVGIHLAARHPGRVRSLSLHSCWDRSDAYLTTVVEMWRTLARARPTVADVVIE